MRQFLLCCVLLLSSCVLNSEPGAGRVCEPGTRALCLYGGPSGTEDVGVCQAGTATCKSDGSGYDACTGEVIPAPTDDCTTLVDDDCDGETNEVTAGCICSPGTAAACYSGPEGTDGVGACRGGLSVCGSDGGGFGSCLGEVTPASAEDCATPYDDDCTGQVNDGCACVPGGAAACYSGPPGTESIVGAACKEGIHVCNTDGQGFGACVGEVTPSPENCASPVDEDCDGVACAQSLWNVCGGDGAVQEGVGVAVDLTGNVIVVGNLFGGADFGGGLLTSAGLADVFVAKFDALGTEIWSKRFGDAAVQVAHGVAVNAAGDVVLTGYATGSVDFGGGVLPNAGAGDVFVAKLDGASGDHIWSYAYGGTSDDTGAAVAIDALDNVLVTGAFRNTIGFGPVLPPLVAQGVGPDVFVAKFDGSGNPLWSRRAGDSSDQEGHSVAADGAGNVLVGGSFQGAIDFGGAALASAGAFDVFVAKFDSLGNHVWSHQFGSPTDDSCNGVAVDGSDNVLLTGYFDGSIDFGGGALASATAGSYDVFLAKFSSGGQHLWSQRFGGLYEQVSYAVTIDAAANVFITGPFESEIDFGGGVLTSVGATDIFLAKFGPSGTPLWSRSFGGSASSDYGNSLATNAAGDVFLTGSVWSPADLGLGPLMCGGGGGTLDAYVASFAP